MTQDKKTEEREYLQYFLSSDEGKKWYQQNKIVSYRDDEAPDFVFVAEDNQKIGLEVTKFIVKSRHGRALQHLMSIGNLVCKYAQKRYRLNISILIDQWNRRVWQARTYKEMLEKRSFIFDDTYQRKEIIIKFCSGQKRFAISLEKLNADKNYLLINRRVGAKKKNKINK